MSEREFVICSTVTKSFYKEFLLFKFSTEIFHPCRWVICCDAEVENALSAFDNVEALCVLDREGDHVAGTDSSAQDFIKVVMTKFDSCLYSVNKYGYSFFMDADMLVTNPFPKQFFNTLYNEDVDMIASPHYTDDFPGMANCGYYNVGMFAVRDRELLEEWKLLTENHKELGMYYEQKPQEFLSRDIFTVSLPFNYNLGWWRFRRENVQQRMNYLTLDDGRIFIGNKPAINFHVHMLKDFKYVNNGQFFKERILNLLSLSKSSEYVEILKYYNFLLK